MSDSEGRLLFTIGHSNHSMEEFAGLLVEHDVEVVIDVRSQPISTYSPHFNRSSLRASLPDGIRYAFMGDVLGGRPEEPEFYDEAGHVLYGPLSRAARFSEGVERLEANCRRYRIVLLCSEADPLTCHRFLLITRVLRERGWDANRIHHILGNGSTRTEEQLAVQGLLLEESWRSPLSVLQNHRRDPSSSASMDPALPH